MNIETKWLKDFVVLAQTNNFSRAAALRHVSQPAYSRRIKALEQQIGYQLVNRQRYPVKLTQQGEAFALTAQKMLNELNSFSQRFEQHNQSKLIVRIAATHTLSLGVLPTVVEQFTKLDVNIETSLSVADADDCINLLDSKHCDYLLAFSDPLLASRVADSILVAKIKLLPVTAANTDKTRKYNLAIENQKIPYLAYQHNIYLGRVVNQLITQQGHSLYIEKCLEAPMADSLKMMALKGLGVAWIPDFSVKQELKSGQLLLAGDEQWELELEVRLYRNDQQNSQLCPVWHCLKNITL